MLQVQEAIEKLRRGSAISECMLWNDPSLNVSLPSEEMELLCQELRGHGRVSTLSLSGNTIKEQAAAVLAKYVSSCKNIKVLDLSFCGLKASSLVTIAKAISSNPYLEGVLLNASYNDVSPEGAVDLARVLTRPSALAHLVLRFNPILEKGVSAILVNCQHLASLDCSYSGIRSPVSKLITSLSSTSIKTVRLCGMELKGNEMQMLHSSVPLGCTLLLDEEAPKHSECPSPVSVTSPVLNKDVEEMMWKEELALLKGTTRDSRGPSLEKAKSPPKPMSPPMRESFAAISPTSSSPPPLASSPYCERAPSSERCSVSRQGSIDRSSSMSRDVRSSTQPISASSVQDSSVQDTTVKSLSLALSVLHDNYSTVSKERDSLRLELEAEVELRKDLERQVQKLKYEMQRREPKDIPKDRDAPREREPRRSVRSVSPKVRNNSSSRRPFNDVGAANNAKDDKSPHKTHRSSPARSRLRSTKSVKTPTLGPGKSPPRNAVTRTLTNRSRRQSSSTSGKF